MTDRTARHPRWAMFPTCAVAIGCLAATLSALPPVRAQQDPEQPLLTWTRSHPLLPTLDDAPLVEVYASGRVRIRRPIGYVSPGIVESTIDQDSIDRLLEQARVALATPIEPRRASDGTRFATSDPTTTTFELPAPAPGPNSRGLALDAPPPVPPARSGFESGVERTTVEVDELAERALVTDDPALDALADVAEELQQLFDAAATEAER